MSLQKNITTLLKANPEKSYSYLAGHYNLLQQWEEQQDNWQTADYGALAIILILMSRDEENYLSAKERLADAKREIKYQMNLGCDYEDLCQVIQDELGLETDYLDVFIF